MRILALEFSSARRSVALLDTDSAQTTRILTRASSETERLIRPFNLIESVLADARTEREEVECLAVGLGPGSYTGIRIAIAIAQGWQLALGVKTLGVSSIESLAAQARASYIFGNVTIAIDAQRGECDLATYLISREHIHPLEYLHLAPGDQVVARLRRGEIVISPDLHPGFPTFHTLFPDAGALAELAATRSDFTAAERLEPLYVRQPSFVKSPPHARSK